MGRMEVGDVSKAAIRGTGKEKEAGVRFPRHTAGVRRRGHELVTTALGPLPLWLPSPKPWTPELALGLTGLF